jgi:hypothetical protein
VVPTAALDTVAKRKIPSPHQESNPDRSDSPSRSLVAIPNLKEIGWNVVDSIRLAQDRDQWWAFVNTVMNLRVS